MLFFNTKDDNISNTWFLKIFPPISALLTRGCDEKDICKNVSQNCSTCTTDMCGGGLGSSGFTLNPMFAPVLAGLLFAVLGR